MTTAQVTTLNDRRTAVYRCYDRDSQLLYVGITHDLRIRWRWHRKNAPWWMDVTDRTVTWFPNRRLAEDEERSAIRNERPVHNIAGRLPSRVAGRRRISPPVASLVADWGAEMVRLAALPEPEVRALQVGRALAAASAEQMLLRELRQVAVRELRAQHLSYAQIGKKLGLHRNRVQQIAEGRTAGGKGGGKAASQ